MASHSPRGKEKRLVLQSLKQQYKGESKLVQGLQGAAPVMPWHRDHRAPGSCSSESVPCSHNRCLSCCLKPWLWWG